jgi:thioredoxin reductase (NADPH)
MSNPAVTKDVYDVVIVGSGPAGYSAAIQAARDGLDTLVFQGFEMGGQIMLYDDIEDYPGVEESMFAPDLADRFERQALNAGAYMRPDNVGRVDLSQRSFKLWAEGQEGGEEPVLARSVIVATGAKGKWLGQEDEQRLMGRGVSGCATCDGFFFSQKAVAVVGGGDRAMHEAMFLTKFAKHVTIVNRSKRFRATKKMLDRVKENPKVSIFEDTVVEMVMGEDTVDGLWLRNVTTGELGILYVEGVFVAVGSSPASGIFKEYLETDEEGYIVQKEGTTTSVAGIFSAGEVSDRRYRTLSSAVGDGSRAALDAGRWIEQRL